MARWLSPQVGFGLVAALYLVSFPYHPALRSPNELCRLWQSRSLVDHGTVVINETLREFGSVGDLSCVARVRVGEVEQLVSCVQPPPAGAQLLEARYYPSKAPMLSFLGAPIYAALKALKAPVSESAQVLFSRLFITVLPTLVMLVFLRRFLSTWLAQPTSDTLTVVYALGTMAFSYSEQFLSHQLTAVLLFGTFYAAWRVQRGDWRERGLLLSGLLAGAVVFTEYTGALGVLGVAAYVVAARWRQWASLGRAVGLVLAGAAPFLIALLAYHQVCFGHPLTSGYKFLNDAAYQGWHLGGFLGIRYPDPRAFVLSAFSPLRGFFTLSPFLVLAFVGLSPLKAAERPQWVMVVALLLGNAYFTSSFTYDSWGWTTGPRHLTPLVPFLILPVGLGLERLLARGGPAFSLAAGLCVSSVLLMSLVTQVNYVPNDLEHVDAQGVFHISTSLFGLAVPLVREGVWPVSWLNAAVPNPGPGVLIIVMVLAATAWVFSRLRDQKAVPALMLFGVVAHLGLLALITDHHSASVSAKNFLKQSWAAPSGQRYDWW
ncbi:MAG: hypothetical protein IAE78_13815 [Myxococcus sp.]|nr:hypothetical protein [Myxococcus sp.]